MKRNKDQWLQKAQEIAKLGNWDLDPTTNKLWWSDQTYRLFNLNPQEKKITFEEFLEMIPPDEKKVIAEKTKKALESDENEYIVDYSLYLPNGELRYVHEEAIVERNIKGEPTRMVGIIQDITDRKKAEIERENLILELHQKIDEINILRGIIPICTHCKNIRDEKGYWEKVEEYIMKNTTVEFSHGICDKCLEKHHPKFQKKLK